jgi:hypothetical protein
MLMKLMNFKLMGNGIHRLLTVHDNYILTEAKKLSLFVLLFIFIYDISSRILFSRYPKKVKACVHLSTKFCLTYNLGNTIILTHVVVARGRKR